MRQCYIVVYASELKMSLHSTVDDLPVVGTKIEIFVFSLRFDLVFGIGRFVFILRKSCSLVHSAMCINVQCFRCHFFSIQFSIRLCVFVRHSYTCIESRPFAFLYARKMFLMSLYGRIVSHDTKSERLPYYSRQHKINEKKQLPIYHAPPSTHPRRRHHRHHHHFSKRCLRR